MQHQVTLLIVIDPSQSNHPALERALLLANHSLGDAAVKMVFLVTPFQQPLQMSPTTLCTSEWLKENIHDRLVDTKVEYSVIMGWGKSSNDIIIKTGEELGATLTIAPYYDQSTGRIFSDEKWKLVREATNPILITSRSHSEYSHRLLCAVKYQDSDYHERNERIIDVATKFSKLFGLELHAVNAYSDSMEFPDRAKIASTSGISNENIHIKLGEPHDVICDVAQDIQADLTVIASHQAKGLKGALRGNMIEKIIQRLDRDILMI